MAYHGAMPTITLIGPGAIGATLAAWLCQDRNNLVSVAARTAFESIELDSPYGKLTASPRVLTSRAQAQPADWVLVATKTYDAESATEWFETAVGPKTRVAVIQNGVEHVSRFANYLDTSRIVPVMIDLPADRLAPGRVKQNGPGTIVVPAGDNGAAFVALFAGTKIDAQVTDDFTTAIWKKLCLNSAGAVCAVLKEPSRIARHDGVADLMRAIVRECVAVARKEGAKIDDSMPDEIVARTRKAPPESTNSMLVDRLNGRRMEIDARNGVIVRLGKKYGIDAPMNALMVAMLEAAQG
jgi:2-dehydropantoate 2-reductase